MLAKAHITVGMAAAFSVIMPEDAAEALPVIAGASLGCLICDIDCDNAAERTDSSHWRKVMACIAAVSLAADHLLDAGMWRTLAQSSAYVWAAGIAVFVLTCAFASVSSHRGFSHSLAALALETLSVHLVFPAIRVGSVKSGTMMMLTRARSQFLLNIAVNATIRAMLTRSRSHLTSSALTC